MPLFRVKVFALRNINILLPIVTPPKIEISISVVRAEAIDVRYQGWEESRKPPNDRRERMLSKHVQTRPVRLRLP